MSEMTFFLAAALLWAPNPPKKFRAEFDPTRYPAAALASLRQGAARIFTNDEWGDYLIWRLYPSHRVFVDGRSDFYGNTFEEAYSDVLKVKYGWEETLARFGVDTVLMPPDAPLSGALKESRRWSLVYDDGVAVVFRSLAKAGETKSATVEDGAKAVERSRNSRHVIERSTIYRGKREMKTVRNTVSYPAAPEDVAGHFEPRAGSHRLLPVRQLKPGFKNLRRAAVRTGEINE